MSFWAREHFHPSFAPEKTMVFNIFTYSIGFGGLLIRQGYEPAPDARHPTASNTHAPLRKHRLLEPAVRIQRHWGLLWILPAGMECGPGRWKRAPRRLLSKPIRPETLAQSQRWNSREYFSGHKLDPFFEHTSPCCRRFTGDTSRPPLG